MLYGTIGVTRRTAFIEDPGPLPAFGRSQYHGYVTAFAQQRSKSERPNESAALKEVAPRGIPAHYKVGSNFHNKLFLLCKNRLSVPLGFKGVTDLPDVPLGREQRQFL